MKIEELFKKAEKFFDMGKKKQKNNNKKRKKIINSLDKKISLIKDKIKNSSNKKKKEQFKKELNILKKLKKEF